jgi:hypothetical protein
MSDATIERITGESTLPSKRPTILLRLDEDAKAALIKAAKADDRSVQYVTERIVLDWLRANGFLKGPEGPAGKKPQAGAFPWRTK